MKAELICLYISSSNLLTKNSKTKQYDIKVTLKKILEVYPGTML